MIAKNTMDKVYKNEISLGYLALLDLMHAEPINSRHPFAT